MEQAFHGPQAYNLLHSSINRPPHRTAVHSHPLRCIVDCRIMQNHHVLILLMVVGMAAVAPDAQPICGSDKLEVQDGGEAVSE